jgi:hypothetical protein
LHENIADSQPWASDIAPLAVDRVCLNESSTALLDISSGCQSRDAWRETLANAQTVSVQAHGGLTRRLADPVFGYLNGFVSPEVALVRATGDNGDVATFEPGPATGREDFPWRGFIAVLPDATWVTVLETLDADGHVLERWENPYPGRPRWPATTPPIATPTPGP